MKLEEEGGGSRKVSFVRIEVCFLNENVRETGQWKVFKDIEDGDLSSLCPSVEDIFSRDRHSLARSSIEVGRETN